MTGGADLIPVPFLWPALPSHPAQTSYKCSSGLFFHLNASLLPPLPSQSAQASACHSSGISFHSIRPFYLPNVQDSSWNVVGKWSSSPKTLNSWAVIDFVANKFDMDLIKSEIMRIHCPVVAINQVSFFITDTLQANSKL